MLRAVTTLPLRGVDKWGSGAFDAPRGSRRHTGVDFAAEPGSILLSPVAGVVTKWGTVYADTPVYEYIQVTDSGGRMHRFYYVQPTHPLGSEMVVLGRLGVVQDITTRYEGIKNHVHYEIKLDRTTYDNPLEE